MSSGTQPDSPVGGDGVETGAGSAAPGLTGSFLSDSDSGSGNHGSGALSARLADVREALSRAMDPVVYRPLGDQVSDEDRARQRRQQLATEAYAEAAVRDGWRRVSVDDDTAVRLVENVLADWVDGNGPQAFWTTEDAARAAVQALRDGGEA